MNYSIAFTCNKSKVTFKNWDNGEEAPVNNANVRMMKGGPGKWSVDNPGETRYVCCIKPSGEYIFSV